MAQEHQAVLAAQEAARQVALAAGVVRSAAISVQVGQQVGKTGIRPSDGFH